MSNTGKERLKVWTPILFSLILILGMILGFNLRDSLRNKRNLTTIIQRSDRLEQLIDLIKDRYVDTVDGNALYADAVEGILSHLDPHTLYIPADELGAVEEKLSGRFFGVGVSFIVINDTMLVTNVVKGGPADKAGVEKGDRIIKVADSVIAGKQLSSNVIPDLLKGPEHTVVSVLLKKVNTDKIDSTVITRGAIPIVSVDAAVMLDSNTGFIKINRFSNTTYDEFAKALNKLKTDGMEHLVLDLRQNPGGYLDQAINIADDFIKGDKLLVYTKGNKSVYKEYKAGEKAGFEDGKIVILVDESSASASEILAGAVQDWDRGIIMGRRTYGKGLVQDRYSLQDGAELRLTIAKYYIPSGRSIQRSFENGKQAYREDLLDRYESGELTGNDSVVIVDTTRYYTANKRVVYGGGGIIPDVYVPYDTTKISAGLLELLYSIDMRNRLWQYYFEHKKELSKYSSLSAFKEEFDAKVIYNYYVKSSDVTTQQLLKLQMKIKDNQDYFLLHMKAQLGRILFDNNGYYKVINDDDIMVQKALTIMGSNNYDSTIAR